MTTTGQARLDVVLGYTQRGWHVIPCCWPDSVGNCGCGRGHQGRDIGKVPLTAHGLKDASTDDAIIRSWWNRWPEANVAIVTGMGSGIIALDVDVDKDGEKSLADLVKRYGAYGETVEEITGGGGRHVFFAHPGVPVSNSVQKIAPGLDIRGDGGYVVVAPSRHASGREYVWEITHHPDDTSLAPFPAWLLILSQPPLPNGKKPAPSMQDRIASGQRNAALASLAGSMRRRGMSQTAIEMALLAENAERCDPPLPVDEVSEIAVSVARYTPAVDPFDTAMGAGGGGGTGAVLGASHVQHLTDSGNAERFVLQHGRDIRYCYAWQKWLHYKDGYWQIDDTGEIDRRAKATVRSWYQAVALEPDDEKGKLILKHAIKSESRDARKAMVQLAQCENGIAIIPDKLDSDPWLLNCRNGTLDLRTGQLHSHCREDLITKLAPVDYDPSADCPTFRAFLYQIFDKDEDLIRFVIRAIGYSLTANTSERCMFILYGVGRNGKSTLLLLLQALLGNYALRTPTSTLMAKRGQAGIPNDVARLQGARLVAASETDEGARLAEATIKDLVGQDVISARFLHAEYFDFVPVCKIWLATNHRPVIKGTDAAIWDRIRLIPFLVRIEDAQVDPDLLNKLKQELSGILTWALLGCLEWQGGRLGAAPAIQQATETYRADMDDLAGFLSECCIIHKTARVKLQELYQEYSLWCVDNNVTAHTERIFRNRITERGFLRKRGHGGSYVWIGLQLQNKGDCSLQTEFEDIQNVQIEAENVDEGERVNVGEAKYTFSSSLLSRREKGKNASPTFTRSPIEIGSLVYPLNGKGERLAATPVMVTDITELEGENWYAVEGTNTRFTADKLELVEQD